MGPLTEFSDLANQFESDVTADADYEGIQVRVADLHVGGQVIRIVHGCSGAAHRGQGGYRLDPETLPWVVRALCSHPRGSADMVVATFESLAHDRLRAQFFDLNGPIAMCGEGIVALGAALHRTTSHRSLEVETAGGVVEVKLPEGPKGDVAVRMPPTRVERTVQLEAPVGRRVIVHVATVAGNRFVVADAGQWNVVVDEPHLPRLRDAGIDIRSQVRAALGDAAPSMVQLVGPVDSNGALPNAVVWGEGCEVDRGPCGTGTCARMAVMMARGEVGIGDVIRSRGIAGGEFRARIAADVADPSGSDGVVVELWGRAELISRAEHAFPAGDRLYGIPVGATGLGRSE